MKQHTKMVEGGVYERKTESEKIRGVLFGSKATTNNGVKIGQIYQVGYTPEKVREGDESLDAWTLVAVPVPLADAEKLSVLLQNADGLLELLKGLPSAIETVQAVRQLRPVPDLLTSSVEAATARKRG